MATYVLWWSEHILRGLLLVLVARNGLFRKYPFFSLYLSSVFAVGLVLMYIYAFEPELYLGFYWYTQFMTAAAGYAVLWEIYKQALKDYPGTFKIAGGVVSALFLGVLMVALFNAFAGEASGLIKSVIAFERNLRTVQGVLLTFLLVFIWYYAIPLGRSLRGLILGYGFFIGVSVITLTLRSYVGASFQAGWQYLQQSSYLITLAIWVPAFWSYAPSSKPSVAICLEEDYAVLAERTSRAIAMARASLLRVFLS